MDKLVETLQQFNLTRIEAQTFLVLLEKGPLNGSQIAKTLNMPRTSIYAALENLFAKEMVFRQTGDISIYQAPPPDAFISRVATSTTGALDYLRDNLKQVSAVDNDSIYWNFKGEPNLHSRIKQFFTEASKEVLISTNYSMKPFERNIINCVERGVRIIVFTFEQIYCDQLPVELYYDSKFEAINSEYKKVLMVSDFEQALMGSGITGGKFSGTFSKNRAIVELISEHIHHNLYFYRLEQKTGHDPFDTDLLINSLQEESFRNNYR